MTNLNPFLFDFAASHMGGGLKRLYEYARWFDDNGGAWFIIHPRCEGLADEFPKNRFIPVRLNAFQRLINDGWYVEGIAKRIGIPDLYFSYGIPIYAKHGRVNWFHLSNVLPLVSREFPLSLFDRVKLNLLGWRIRRCFQNAEIISAESEYSLGLINSVITEKLFLSVNGSDDELLFFRSDSTEERDDVATVVGTYRHKALDESFHVFNMLKKDSRQLRMQIIGDEKYIPMGLRDREDIIVKGRLGRGDVIQCLRKSKYYISTTHIENSYNASSEGVFLAQESLISDIGPHRELVRDLPYERVEVPNVKRPLLHIRRRDLSGAHLRTWEGIISDMIQRARIELENGC